MPKRVRGSGRYILIGVGQVAGRCMVDGERLNKDER